MGPVAGSASEDLAIQSSPVSGRPESSAINRRRGGFRISDDREQFGRFHHRSSELREPLRLVPALERHGTWSWLRPTTANANPGRANSPRQYLSPHQRQSLAAFADCPRPHTTRSREVAVSRKWSQAVRRFRVAPASRQMRSNASSRTRRCAARFDWRACHLRLLASGLRARVSWDFAHVVR
jgi:hypothetical protein